MINLSSIRSVNRRESSLFLPILAIGILLTAVFIASCGDEGDTTEDTTGMMDIVQPTTPATTDPTPPVVDEVPDVIEEPIVSFKGDIQPILAERCATPGCHVVGHFTGLDLSQYDAFKKGGNGGPVFTAGDGDGSLVVNRIDGGGMPPGGPPLDADQIQLFIDWIDEGAENN